jgi:hypothetical protein
MVTSTLLNTASKTDRTLNSPEYLLALVNVQNLVFYATHFNAKQTETSKFDFITGGHNGKGN